MLWALAFLAAAAGPTVEATLDKAEATVGELIAYQLTVQHPESLTVPTPRPTVPSGIRLTSTAAPTEVEAEPGVLRTTFRYALAAYETGTYLVPPTTVTLVEPSGSTSVVQTDTLFFSVKSVLGAGADTTDIRDVKPPVAPGWVPPFWAIVAVAVTGVGATVLVFLRLRRRRPAPAAPPIPPEQLARERIRRLKGVIPTDIRALRRYYSDLSFLLRDYLESATAVPALESTTCELLASLEQRDGAVRWLETLACVLGEADLVKFAKHEPATEQVRQALESAELVVEAVRQQEALRAAARIGDAAEPALSQPREGPTA
jgi:hypothetical protein